MHSQPYCMTGHYKTLLTLTLTLYTGRHCRLFHAVSPSGWSRNYISGRRLVRARSERPRAGVGLSGGAANLLPTRAVWERCKLPQRRPAEHILVDFDYWDKVPSSVLALLSFPFFLSYRPDPKISWNAYYTLPSLFLRSPFPYPSPCSLVSPSFPSSFSPVPSLYPFPFPFPQGGPRSAVSSSVGCGAEPWRESICAIFPLENAFVGTVVIFTPKTTGTNPIELPGHLSQ